MEILVFSLEAQLELLSTLFEGEDMFTVSAIPFVAQTSTAAEVPVPNTTMDMGGTTLGTACWFLKETGGLNGVTVGIQVCMDGLTWLPSSFSALTANVAAGAENSLTLSPGVTTLLPRYVRLSVIDQVSGLHGNLLVQGGFGK